MSDLLTYGLVLLFVLAIISRLAVHLVGMFRNDDLRELVGTITISGERDTAFNELFVAIQAAGFTVQRANRDKAEVVVRCLTRRVNLFLWRCWSDRLLFAVTRGNEGRARVNVYAIPNLFRVSVAKTESISDAEQVIAAVQKNTSGR